MLYHSSYISNVLQSQHKRLKMSNGYRKVDTTNIVQFVAGRSSRQRNEARSLVHTIQAHIHTYKERARQTARRHIGNCQNNATA